MQEGQFVEHVGEPLALLLPVDIQAPQHIVEGLAAHCHLGGECLLIYTLQRTTQLEVLGEIILPVYSVERFSLHTVVTVALQRHVDGCSGINDALIENGYFTC